MGISEFYDGEESSEDETVEGAEEASPGWVDDEMEDVFVLEVDDYGYPIQDENHSPTENGQDLESVVSGSQDESDSSVNDYKGWTPTSGIRELSNLDIENPTITEEWFSNPLVPEFVQLFASVDEMCDPMNDCLRPVVVEGWDDTKEKEWVDYLKKKASSPVKKVKDETQMSDDEFAVHLNVLDALYLIKTTSLARQGLKKLHNLLTQYDINLNTYFDDLDYSSIRYIAWGLNFYYMCESESAVRDRLCANKCLTFLEMSMMDAASLIICEPYTDIINPKYWALFLKWYAKKYVKSKLRIMKKHHALKPQEENLNSEIPTI